MFFSIVAYFFLIAMAYREILILLDVRHLHDSILPFLLLSRSSRIQTADGHR